MNFYQGRRGGKEEGPLPLPRPERKNHAKKRTRETPSFAISNHRRRNACRQGLCVKAGGNISWGGHLPSVSALRLRRSLAFFYSSGNREGGKKKVSAKKIPLLRGAELDVPGGSRAKEKSQMCYLLRKLVTSN